MKKKKLAKALKRNNILLIELRDQFDNDMGEMIQDDINKNKKILDKFKIQNLQRRW